MLLSNRSIFFTCLYHQQSLEMVLEFFERLRQMVMVITWSFVSWYISTWLFIQHFLRPSKMCFPHKLHGFTSFDNFHRKCNGTKAEMKGKHANNLQPLNTQSSVWSSCQLLYNKHLHILIFLAHEAFEIIQFLSTVTGFTLMIHPKETSSQSVHQAQQFNIYCVHLVSIQESDCSFQQSQNILETIILKHIRGLTQVSMRKQ